MQTKRPNRKVDQPGTSLFPNAPSNFIDVQDSDLLNGNPAKSSVILFNWMEFINQTIAHESNQAIRNNFIQGISGVLRKLGHVGDLISINEDYSDITLNEDVESFLNKEINKSLTSFHINLNTNLGGSSASISLENIDDKWIIDEKGVFYKQPLIQEGIRFVIDAQERFNPDYFCRMFTGFVVRADVVANPMTKALNLTCTDYARYLTRSKYNVQPAAKETKKWLLSEKVTAFSNRLHGLPGREIVKKLASGGSKAERIALGIVEANLWEELPIQTDDAEIILEKDNRNWQHRYPKDIYKKGGGDFRYGTYLPRLLAWGDSGSVYRELINTFSLYVSEIQTKKDILTNVAGLTFFSLYFDGAGNLHYHPPRFEYKSYSRVKHGMALGDEKEPELLYQAIDDELISQTYGQGEGGIVTVMNGYYEPNYYELSPIDPKLTRKILIWEDGINRHGILEAQFSTAAIQGEANAKTYLPLATAASLVRRNLERFTMNISMPLRPELQVDRPLYDTNTERVYYIKGITHTFNAGTPNSGGTWQTDAICSMGRDPEFDPISNVFSDKIAKTFDITKIGGTMFNLKDVSTAYIA